MKLTYFGHSCFAVEVAGTTLLFDPFITPNPLAAHIPLKDIKADFILLSHGHEDHVADAPALARQTGARVIANYETHLWLTRQGVQNSHPVNHGGRLREGVLSIQFVSAIHSSLLPDGTYGGNPGGFVVESPEGNFYYTGDTALTYDMKLIGETVPLKFSVMCIGDNFTMGAEDAIRAAEFIRCNQIVGVHYDTFPPIKIDHEKAIEAFGLNGKILYLPAIGKSIEF